MTRSFYFTGPIKNKSSDLMQRSQKFLPFTSTQHLAGEVTKGDISNKTVAIENPLVKNVQNTQKSNLCDHSTRIKYEIYFIREISLNN